VLSGTWYYSLIGMYNARILDHFERPRNAGELPPPALHTEVTNPVCGDILHLWMLVDCGCIRDIRFKTKGCVSAIACSSVLTEMVAGKRLEEAQRLSATDIAMAIGGLPPESGHAAELAAQALKSVLQLAMTRGG